MVEVNRLVYEVIDAEDGTVLARDMPLESAIIFIKGFFKEYHNEELSLTINALYNTKTATEEEVG